MLLFHKLIKLHLNSYYFHVIVIHFGKLFQKLWTRNLSIFNVNVVMANLVLLAAFFNLAFLLISVPCTE